MKEYKTITVSAADYHEACSSDTGFCPDCGEFTREMTEPDAEEYGCPQCNNSNVVGAEQALILFLIDPVE